MMDSEQLKEMHSDNLNQLQERHPELVNAIGIHNLKHAPLSLMVSRDHDYIDFFRSEDVPDSPLFIGKYISGRVYVVLHCIDPAGRHHVGVIHERWLKGPLMCASHQGLSVGLPMQYGVNTGEIRTIFNGTHPALRPIPMSDAVPRISGDDPSIPLKRVNGKLEFQSRKNRERCHKFTYFFGTVAAVVGAYLWRGR